MKVTSISRFRQLIDNDYKYTSSLFINEHGYSLGIKIFAMKFDKKNLYIPFKLQCEDRPQQNIRCKVYDS